MQRATFMEKARTLGLGRVAAQLFDAARPCCRLTGSSRAAAPGDGASRVGGTPDLPPDFKWPMWKDAPQSFVAQINLARVGDGGRKSGLPRRGLLSFFYNEEQDTWGFDPGDKGSWQVSYIPASDTRLRSTSGPEDLETPVGFQEKSISLRSGLSVPSRSSSTVSGLALTETERSQLAKLSAWAEGYKAPRHKLLGHPDLIQGDMELQCQLASNGIHCGSGDGHRSRKAVALSPGASDWILLLQVDSDDDTGMMWGDSGMLCFWIRKQDLAAQAFERVWMILQCH